MNHYVRVAINNEFQCVFFGIFTSELHVLAFFFEEKGSTQTASISSRPYISPYQTAYSKLHVCIY